MTYIQTSIHPSIHTFRMMIWYLVCVCAFASNGHVHEQLHVHRPTCLRIPSIHSDPFGSNDTHTHIHRCTHAHIHTCMHAYAFTGTYIHIHILTCTYIHIPRIHFLDDLTCTYLHIHIYRQTDRRIISWLFQHFPHSENSQDWPLGISTCGSLGHPFLCRAPCIRAVHGTCMKGPRSGMGRDGPLWLSWCQL